MPEKPYKTQETTTDKMITELYQNMLLEKKNADDNQFKEAKNLDMQSKTISNVLDPTADQETATKKYHDDNLSELGAWVDKTADYGAQQASTDGFVCAGNTAAEVQGYTDAAANPTTLRADNDYTGQCSIMFPVKKDDYWKVIKIGAGTAFYCYWIPIS